jgi:hypothetical protein
MKESEIPRLELSVERVLELLEHAKAALSEVDYRDLENIVKSFAHVSRLLDERNMSVRRLRKIIFGAKSEKFCKVLEKLKERREEEPGASSAEAATPRGEDAEGAASVSGENGAPGQEPNEGAADEKTKKKRKGHGRNGANAYEGAEREPVSYGSLQAGDACPEPGCKGRVYPLKPRVMVRIVGQTPLGAKVWELERLRCNLCLKIFSAEAPRECGPKKYDESAGSMIALLRYGTGVPFNRLKGLQRNLGVPLPASTQWDVVERVAKRIKAVLRALIDEAAQGDVLHNDDTSMKILSLMKKKKDKEKEKEKSDDG